MDLVKGLWKANADQHLLSFLQPYIDDMGPNLELRILGNVGLVTVDPENVKTVLSKSKFREGELGKPNVGHFKVKKLTLRQILFMGRDETLSSPFLVRVSSLKMALHGNVRAKCYESSSVGYNITI